MVAELVFYKKDKNDTQAWLEGLKELKGQWKAQFARDTPENLNQEQFDEWIAILVGCLVELKVDGNE